MNQSCGRTTSRRDDIEAALLVLIYLLNNSRLPWSDFSVRYKDNKNLKLRDYLAKKMEKKSIEALLKMVPVRLRRCFYKTMALKFE